MTRPASLKPLASLEALTLCALASLAGALLAGCATPHEHTGAGTASSTPGMRTEPGVLAANAPEEGPPWHLKGYYNLNWTSPAWVDSNNEPWTPDLSGKWVDSRLVKWGYTPVTHDGKNYYCLIGNYPQAGTAFRRRNFACGDAWAVEQQYNNGHPPTFLLYGNAPEH